VHVTSVAGGYYFENKEAGSDGQIALTASLYDALSMLIYYAVSAVHCSRQCLNPSQGFHATLKPLHYNDPALHRQRLVVR
jgi:hypothetical protein